MQRTLLCMRRTIRLCLVSRRAVARADLARFRQASRGESRCQRPRQRPPTRLMKALSLLARPVWSTVDHQPLNQTWPDCILLVQLTSTSRSTLDPANCSMDRFPAKSGRRQVACSFSRIYPTLSPTSKSTDPDPGSVQLVSRLASCVLRPAFVPMRARLVQVLVYCIPRSTGNQPNRLSARIADTSSLGHLPPISRSLPRPPPPACHLLIARSLFRLNWGAPSLLQRPTLPGTWATLG